MTEVRDFRIQGVQKKEIRSPNKKKNHIQVERDWYYHLYKKCSHDESINTMHSAFNANFYTVYWL